MEARVGQGREEVPVGERGVRETVHAQGERPLAGLQVLELDPVRSDPTSLELRHVRLFLEW